MNKDKDNTKEKEQSLLFETMTLPRFMMRTKRNEPYTVFDANEIALDYFSHKQLVGKRIEEFLDEEAVLPFQHAMDSSIEQQAPVFFKVSPDIPIGTRLDGFIIKPVFDKDGSIRFIDVLALPGGGPPTSLQRERDDAITLLTSVFDVSEVGIVVTDQDQRIIRVNDSFIRMYGWEREELIGKQSVELVTPDEREQAKKNHEEFLSSGIRSSGEMKIIRKDGNIANALFTTAALELSNNRRFQVTTIMDITLRKQMEMTLRMAKEQADAANQAKSTFLANMSHELRTPLNAIIGFSEMMMKGTFGPLANKKYEEYLGDIHLSARHLLDIINEVLDMSKIEAGKVDLDEEYFSMEHMVTAVIRMMDSRAFSSGLKIEEKIEVGLPPFFGDPRLIRQILINLVCNAVKYSTSGGTVTVVAQTTEDDKLQIQVADTGVGIPKHQIQEALEPFGQVTRPVDAGGQQGTGLGLPLAKAMVELHGGTLSIESDVGQGTIVTIVFPERRTKKNQQKSDESPLANIKKVAQSAE